MDRFSLGDVQRVTSATEEKYGLPTGTLFKIAGIESSYRPNAVSPKGAQGWFQFMPATAKQYGVADPSNLEQSADGAGRFMADLLKKYNGNMDLALAYYNGGGKAAQALAKGKPWPETADYLSKFYGNRFTPLGPQFRTGTPQQFSVGPSASELDKQKQQRDAEYGGFINNVANLPRAVSLGFQQENTVWNYFQERGLEQVDPDWNWDQKTAEEMLKGVPQQYWDYVLQAKSAREAEARRSRMMDSLERQQELGKMGVAGFAGAMTGALVDIPTLIAFVPGAGGAGLLTTTSRLANAARLGLFGAGTNVGIEAATQQFRPLAETSDLYIAGAMGFALGGGPAAMINPQSIAARRFAEEFSQLRKWGEENGLKAQLKELSDAGADPKAVSEWLKKVKGGDTGAAPPVIRDPGVGIIMPGDGPNGPRIIPPENPPIDDVPPAPRGGAEPPIEPPPAPRPGDLGDTPGVPGAEPPAAPKAPPSDRKVPWGEEWDSPRFIERYGSKDLLVLPDLPRISQLADYVRQFSRNKDLVALMDRALKGIDLRKIEFHLASVGKRTGNRLVDDNIKSAYGLVGTPYFSRGEGIVMALRDSTWGASKHGMNEETFIHELLHVNTVYKVNALERGDSAMTAKSRQAYTELNELFKFVKNRAKTEFGAGWQGEIFGRLGTNLENVKEFISYGLSYRPFQEWMKTVQVPGARTNLWDRFTNSLRRMLGMDLKDSNAFARLIDLSSAITEKAGVEKVTKRTQKDLVPEGPMGIDKETVDAANAAEIGPVYGVGLGLEHRLGSMKVPAPVRALASKLFGSTVGYKNHAVVQSNAWEDTLKMAEGWAVKIRKEAYPAFEEWLKTTNYKWHQKGAAFDDFGTQVSSYIRGIDGEYSAQVIKAGEAIRKQLADVVDHINNPLLSEGGVKRGLTEVEIRDPKTGETAVVGKLEKNPNYLPRKHDVHKWNDLVNSFGRESVEGWWARAYMRGRDNVTAEEASRWSKWYVKTVEEAHANRSQEYLEDMMRGADRDGLIESLKRNGGFSEAEARKIVEDMLPASPKDTGRPFSSLKHRNTIDETYTETWIKPDGTRMEVGVNDFVMSNALDVVENYLRRMAGSIALARHVDVYKLADIDKAILDATSNKLGTDFKAQANVGKLRDDLRFAFDRILGIPQEEFSAFNKSMDMWRSFNVIRLMGGAVWNQAIEMAQIAGSMGWKATLAAIPELRAVRRDIRTGKAPTELLDHLENTLGGAGAEYIGRLEFRSSDDWTRNRGDTAFNRRLDALDTGLKKMARGVLDYTGMTPLMIQQKRIHAIALVNHFVNHANGKIKSSFLTNDRLAWMGMNEADFSALTAALKRYSKSKDGEFSKGYKLDVETWVKEDPATHSKFMTAIHRESRRVIQENDLASMVPIMGTTIGKTMFQFMNFTIQGWNKSMLFAMNHRDITTFSTVMHGGMIASLAYMGRTMVQSTGLNEEQRQKFMDERMNAKQIVANSFGRIAQASMLPQLIDTVSPVPFFSGMRTTSDLSSLASNPTLQAINSVLSMKKIIRNGLSDEYQTTERDVKSWARLLPMNNIMPFSTIINSVAAEFPSSEEE